MANEFKLDGLEAPVTLPEEYLTVKQWEDCLRFFISSDADEINFQDLAVLRQLTTILVPNVDLAALPMTPDNFNTLTNMYKHVGSLIVKAMGMGEEVIEENLTEGAKAPATPKTAKKKKGRPRKNN